MSDDVRTLICSLVSQQPREETVPGSEVRWCSICAEEVWMSPVALAFADKHHDVSVQCYPCGVGAAATSDTVRIEPVPGFVPDPSTRAPVYRQFKADVKRARRKRA